jgi:hypothetical protein
VSPGIFCLLCRSASIGFHSPYYPVIFLTYDLRNLLLLWQLAVPNHHAVGPDLSKPVKWASPTRTLSLGMAHPGRNSSLPGEFPGRKEECQRCWGSCHWEWISIPYRRAKGPKFIDRLFRGLRVIVRQMKLGLCLDLLHPCPRGWRCHCYSRLHSFGAGPAILR